ncbi:MULTISPECIES: hypothetical protein [Novosphingobium]|uniref:hypothetical protein n=1 Tax=Novosphingobium TaxID=165696 RepID=UPI0022F27538|nr:hypothetical protein [Novosphingobium resinovorum]GLK46069.1 hypothetical protein GCM10017612_39910 [Novosphingobium resinovorum]
MFSRQVMSPDGKTPKLAENDMVLKTVAPLAAAAFIAVPVAAQDIVPIISPGQAAEGVFNRARMEEQARRQREKDAGQEASSDTPSDSRPAPGTPEFQKQACDNRPIYRRQYGEDHPQVQKLEALCKASGY